MSDWIPKVGDLLSGAKIVGCDGVEEWFSFPRYRVIGWTSDITRMAVEVLNERGEVVGISGFHKKDVINKGQVAEYPLTVSQADKYHDEQIDILQRMVAGKSKGNLSVGGSLSTSIAKGLYDINVRVLADDEVIVKPLSGEQKRKIRSEAYSSDYAVFALIDAIQRELGVIK